MFLKINPPSFFKGLLTGNNVRCTATLRVSQEGFGRIKRGGRELYLLGTGDRWPVNRRFLDFPIVIDCDRGHYYEHLKKNQIRMKIEPVTCIWMFVYVINFELPEMAQKWSFGLFRPNLPQLGLFHPYFVSKSSFREISMIKIVILDQSKPISVIFKIKE